MGQFLKNKGIVCFIIINTRNLKFKYVSRLFLSIKLIVFISFLSFGQNITKQEKQGIINNKISKVEDIFYSSNCGYYPLVNGKIYDTYYTRIIGHQYFNSSNWEKGFVIIKDEVHTNLLLKYDVFNDKLIYHHLSSEGAINLELNKNEVDAFSLAGHNFINIKLDNTFDKNNGYYEVLFNGEALLLIKWEKYISKSTDINRSEISQKKLVYIRNEDKIIKIKNRKSIIEALYDKSEEMKEYIKQKKLHIKLASDEDLIRLMQYYDDL